MLQTSILPGPGASTLFGAGWQQLCLFQDAASSHVDDAL